MTLAFVDYQGRVVEDPKPTPSEAPAEPFELKVAREHAKFSTTHAFTLHPAYTGAGCALCGEARESVRHNK
jgi:hypothetical protein